MSTLKDSKPLMDISDYELIQQFLQGQMAAFDKLVQRYEKRVYAIAISYINNSDDVKDIYQEVFLRVYRGLPKFRFKSEFSTWLYRITTNVCLTYRKSHSKNKLFNIHHETDDDPLSNIAAEQSSTDTQILDNEITERVQRALEILSPQQKLVFTLRHYNGYKLKEIAEMINCSEGTVKKYFFTAIRRMREQLKDLYY